MKNIVIFYALLVVVALNLQACFFSSGNQVMECFKDVDVEDIAGNIQIMHQRKNPQKIKIPEINSEKTYSFTAKELFDTIRIVPLETTEMSILGTISKIMIHNDTIFVSDIMKAKTLVMFTIDGKFIGKIGSIGNGPGEYIEPTDFYVGKNIVLYDQFQQKLIFYDKTGKLISEKQMPFICIQFSILNDNLYVFRDVDSRNTHISELKGYNLWTSDSTFHIKRKGLFREKGKWIALFSPNSMTMSNDYLYVNDMFSDTLFRIDTAGHLNSEYWFDFNGHRSEEVMQSNRKMKEEIKKANYYVLHDCLISTNYVNCFLSVKKKGFGIYYSKKTQQTICLNELLLGSNISFNAPTSPKFVFEDTFVCNEYAHNLLKNSNFSELSKYIGGNFDNIKPEDNPVLIFYKMKKW